MNKNKELNEIWKVLCKTQEQINFILKKIIEINKTKGE